MQGLHAVFVPMYSVLLISPICDLDLVCCRISANVRVVFCCEARREPYYKMLE